jgi:NTP pyrophosphatase (non-canonical NTP hydrolase)
MEELRLKVIEWAKDRGILDRGTALSQGTKVLEECLELVVADLNKDEAEIKDAVGDILVTVILECEILKKSWKKVEFLELLEYAIKDLEGISGKAFSSDVLYYALELYQHVETDIAPTQSVRDVLAFLLSYCKQNGIDPRECLQGAYDVISKRKGKMVNGVFVKDQLPTAKLKLKYK